MLSLRRACVVATTAPLVLASCADLGGLSSSGPGDGGAPTADAADAADAADDVDAAAPPTGPLCPAGQKECSGGCVPMDLPEYGCGAATCERCSLPNAQTVVCEAGRCAVGTCKPGWASCDGDTSNGCEADLNDSKTCGSCTRACPPGTPFCALGGQCVVACGGREVPCGTRCVELTGSPTNCGACGNVCPGAPNAVPGCLNGKCTIECNVGFGDCNPGSAGCEALKPYYLDADGDGFGAGPKVGDACTAPQGHSQAAGDCMGSNPDVKPGQTQFFALGYTNGAGQTSYDYDCNGLEELVGSTPVGSCDACRAGDYIGGPRANAPVNANVHCGSTTKIVSCNSSCSTSSASAVVCR